MAFEDLVRTVTLNFSVFALDASQRFRNARARAQAGTLTANEAAIDFVTSSALALDAWACLFAGATSLVGLVFISSPVAGVPNAGPGPGGSVVLPSVPTGPLDWTALAQKPAGPGNIPKVNLTAALAGATLNVNLLNAGAVVTAGLFAGDVTKGGTPIANVIVHLF